ncbi:hypothetical protein ANO11243_014940 [Dothideomycetidae sp. 11243]|nr:hypothetical protein ANO11243_014940 [fungal sp. No.11243]
MDQHSSPSRPRAGSRSFSLHSDKSGHGKDHVQTPGDRAEKERRDSFMRGESKANPNAAVQELQPQAEPDLSNPTRSRWERPLDTIRSFERAIDGDYKRRTISRGRFNGGPSPSKANGYYSNRPESFYDSYGGAPPPPRARFSRGMSEGGMGRHFNGYGQTPQNGFNVASHEGSDSTGPWGNSTDPSSQNSSYERLNGINKHGQSPEHNYGAHDNYAARPINEEIDDYGYPPRPPQKSFNQYGSPPPPPHAEPVARQPIKLGGHPGDSQIERQGGQLPTTPRPAAEKRQSWLSRRFSKSK